MRVQRRLGVALLAFGFAFCGLAGGARAAEAKKADATGTWKSSFKTPQGQTFETTFKLKQEGNKLTGTVKGQRGPEAKIEKGKVEGDKISFQVTREFMDRKFTIKYRGTVKGDTIKGKVEFPGRGGNAGQARDWEAKREK